MPATPQRSAARSGARPSARPKWMKPFLAALADTSNVSAAARKGKVDTSTVYERRRHDAAFAREWQVALCEGYDNLEMDVLYRLRTGELRPVAGAKRAVRQYDNATALRLLAAHRESTTKARAIRDNVSAADIRASIDRKVELIRERVMAARALPDPQVAAHPSTVTIDANAE
jgi:hypothetical protein